MLVKATQLGYYEHKRRREGEVFKLKDEKAFSKRWMEVVDEKSAPKSAPAPAESKPKSFGRKSAL